LDDRVGEENIPFESYFSLRGLVIERLFCEDGVAGNVVVEVFGENLEAELNSAIVEFYKLISN